MALKKVIFFLALASMSSSEFIYETEYSILEHEAQSCPLRLIRLPKTVGEYYVHRIKDNIRECLPYTCDTLRSVETMAEIEIDTVDGGKQWIRALVPNATSCYRRIKYYSSHA
ncbi:hypothetical protein PRIPAC_95282 [Pristionchus pacificus]|uniref:Uncharacterized protein n=1 Tax=Pristionchus pacificus TaxID=54126 RepID=A0A454XIG5_PRIPA|nr:hypothetical protein PRIPAC_95282 [Pristionchus pacificus]|eukprot:PDM81609.1 hypothetical protein PRIPAC_30590 [Pristionchus pacificus]